MNGNDPYLVLVNRENPYVERVTSKLQLVNAAQAVYLQEKAAKQLQALLHKIEAGGRIIPVSGHRSRFEQEQIYRKSIHENGKQFTQKYVALPGCSEHETGLAVDLAEWAMEVDELTPQFPYCGICQEFRNQAARYGFIERYPKGKEQITGIGHEPWHFRYVGAEHACRMEREELTLEEYVAHIFAMETARCTG